MKIGEITINQIFEICKNHPKCDGCPFDEILCNMDDNVYHFFGIDNPDEWAKYGYLDKEVNLNGNDG